MRSFSISMTAAMRRGPQGLAPLIAVIGGGSTLLTRRIHTPPGGFVEDLPPSFGRTNAKGELSSVNLRRKKHQQLRRRKMKKKLLIPDSTLLLSPDKIKEELLGLKRRTSAYAGKKEFCESDTIHILGGEEEDDINNTEEKAIAEGDSYFHHHAFPAGDKAALNSEEGEGGEGRRRSSSSSHAAVHATQGQGGGGGLPTLLDAAMSETTVSGTAEKHTLPIPTRTPGGGKYTEHPGNWKEEQSLERRFAVTPGSTVFGSDLDRLERDMMRDFAQRGTRLPPPDRVYSTFGDGRAGKRMAWEPSSSFDKMKKPAAAASPSSSSPSAKVLGDANNRNLSPYHMSAEAYRERQQWLATSHVARAQSSSELAPAADDNTDSGNAAVSSDLPADSNPHFPSYSGADDAHDANNTHVGGGEEEESSSDPMSLPYHERDRTIVINARTDYHTNLQTAGADVDDDGNDNAFTYDAFNQRPAEKKLVELRGIEYWSHYENRQRLEEHVEYRQELFEQEKLAEGAMDTSEVEYSINAVRKEVFLYFQAHPINEMIQEPFVRIREIVPKDGGEKILFRPNIPIEMRSSPKDDEALQHLNMDVDVPIQEARRLAQRLGSDLIRIGAIHTQKSDRRVVALCQIGDHREHMREMIKFKIQKLGVQPPPTKQCIEVPFRGGTHPHAIRFKSVGIAKHILRRHVIRVNLTKFGTPREGFPVFQSILDEIKRQCLHLKAYHKAGEIQTNYNEIFCFLYPSTGRSPKTTVDHPTVSKVREARDQHVLESEREVYFDDLQNQRTQKERLRYLTKIDRGTAWAEKDEGMSLQKQRAIKVMLGYIPKGNKELYAARGDVNIPAPFRASHQTSTERWSHPVESNLEQASRGAAALGKRAAMPISEMHDRGETPENATELDRFYYRVQGSALEVGELKEALGLKDNRKKRPPLGPGFATLGVGKSTSDARTAAK